MGTIVLNIAGKTSDEKLIETAKHEAKKANRKMHKFDELADAEKFAATHETGKIWHTGYMPNDADSGYCVYEY